MGRFDGLDDEEIEGTIGGHNPRFADDDDVDEYEEDDDDGDDDDDTDGWDDDADY